MNYYVVKNNQRINLLDIPTIDFEILRAHLVVTNLRVVAFFGADWGSDVKLFVALADDEKGEILLSKRFECCFNIFLNNRFNSFHFSF